MLSIIKPIDNYECDYKLGIKPLVKDVEYVINKNWAAELGLNPIPIEVPDIDISTDFSNKRLLIIRAMGAGDILFLSPIIQLIKEKYPSVQIGFTSISEQLGVAEMIPNLDETYSYPIEKEHFDSFDYYFQVAHVIEGNIENKNKNIYQAYFETISSDNINPGLFRPIIKSSLYENFETKKGLIGIHPFANDPLRSLNAGIVNTLYLKLKEAGFTPILIGTKAEREKIKPFWKYKWSCDDYPEVLDLIKLVAECEFTICTDSFITHLSQAIGTETICIYGPFASESRVGSYKNIHIIDSNPECRCSMHQLGRCRRGLPEPVCLRFDIQTVIDIVQKNKTILDEMPFISTPEIIHYGLSDE